MQQLDKIARAASRFKQLVTMDTILLTFVITFSLFWALVFNSTDNPMENQPINIVIDVKRNLQQFDSLMWYFFQFLFVYASGYLFYWVNHHILVDRVMSRFGVFHYLWTSIIFTLIASPVISQLVLLLPVNTSEFTLLPSGNHDPFDNWNLLIATIIMTFSLPLILSFKWLQKEAEVAKLKQEKTQTELRWLQQQINPHFLFNTLNNLYSLTLSKSEKAPQSILQLSNILRFVVYQGDKERVRLHDEIEYLSDYIALESIRVKNKTTINFDVGDAVTAKAKSLRIAPLMLMILIENAFKHGINRTDKASWLAFSLSLDNNQLIIRCVNSVDEEADPLSICTIGQQQGLGLDNLSRRLELIYPKKHWFYTISNKNEFLAELTLELDSDD